MKIHRSVDLGKTWQMADGPAFPQESGMKVKRIWRVLSADRGRDIGPHG